MNDTLLDDPARATVVYSAASRLEPGMTLGLGSGRAAWALIVVLGTRWVGQSTRVVVDGADQVDPALNLIKGHGAALLHEKLLVAASRRFLVIAEQAKFAKRLGEGVLLPVEVADEVLLGSPDGRVQTLSAENLRR